MLGSTQWKVLPLITPCMKSVSSRDTPQDGCGGLSESKTVIARDKCEFALWWNLLGYRTLMYTIELSHQVAV